MSFYGPRLLNTGVGSHIVRHPDVAADHRVVADGDASQDAGIAINSDIILESRQ